MAKQPDESADAFDIRTIRQLIKLMNENALTEVDLRNGAQRVRLRKQGNEIVPVTHGAQAAAPAAAAAVTPPDSGAPHD